MDCRGCMMVVVVVAIAGLRLDPAQACSCELKHPQQHVCEADFVMNVRVQRQTRTPDGLTAYKVRVKRLFKGNDKVKLALRKGLLYTHPNTCEVKLDKRTCYVVTGDVEAGKLWTSICHLAKPRRSLTPKMKKGIRLLYQSGCDCPIMSCHWWDRCPKADFLCTWETSTFPSDCQGKHSVCLRGPDGRCGWLAGRRYHTCTKQQQRIHGQSPNSRGGSSGGGGKINSISSISSNTTDALKNKASLSDGGDGTIHTATRFGDTTENGVTVTRRRGSSRRGSRRRRIKDKGGGLTGRAFRAPRWKGNSIQASRRQRGGAGAQRGIYRRRRKPLSKWPLPPQQAKSAEVPKPEVLDFPAVPQPVPVKH